MSDIVAPPGVRSPEKTRRLAWTVLGVSFALWITLVVAGWNAFQRFVAEATVARPPELAVVQGPVLVQTEQGAPWINAETGLRIEEGDRLEVRGGRARLQFFEESLVELYAGARVRLLEASQGWFHREEAHLALVQEEGAGRIVVSETSLDDRRFLVRTPAGDVELSPGEFIVWTRPEGEVHVTARTGTATARVPTGAVAITTGQKVILSAHAMPKGPLPAAEALLYNGDFSRGLEGWEPWHVQEEGRPDVPGVRELVDDVVDGRPVRALRVWRDSQLDTHNETGLMQRIQRDVSAYRSVVLSALVKVNHASLSGGGYMGSEYPMMLRVRYRDATGGQRDWYHGFYYQNPEQRPTRQGEQIPQGVWFRYVGDLMQLDPPPVTILSVEVLGAGHDYDAEITEISLVAE